MKQYILFIHGNAKTQSTAEEWETFFCAARASGLFNGGSAIGERCMLGEPSAPSSDHIVGYMRFDAENKQQIVDLLKQHPVLVHGGSAELCEMPKT
ncbi:hypothetical protein [Cerasicoccus arenae]|uniref:YCII-related domain-containing protein n=1 Tax=Cerasicoccus arenae TaxID=424488 RepID=A0A8J3DIC8_9BACT|nr:hypothetical protein [Cerasicoccus arenae]MBK1856828.1 hypothetical protein [Cerasicoccus arenae]GHC11122.1 hypothetical protein GCM10007047_30520 [Cerasicoccus arenae]